MLILLLPATKTLIALFLLPLSSYHSSSYHSQHPTALFILLLSHKKTLIASSSYRTLTIIFIPITLFVLLQCFFCCKNSESRHTHFSLLPLPIQCIALFLLQAHTPPLYATPTVECIAKATALIVMMVYSHVFSCKQVRRWLRR